MVRYYRYEYEPVECDECGKTVCMARQFDLNGTWFCCNDCWDSGKEMTQGKKW